MHHEVWMTTSVPKCIEDQSRLPLVLLCFHMSHCLGMGPFTELEVCILARLTGSGDIGISLSLKPSARGSDTQYYVVGAGDSYRVLKY